MTADEKKGHLFYIYWVGKGFDYDTVDPKQYSEDGLKNFAKQFAKDEIFYKTEKECQDVIKELNAGLHTTFDFTSTNGVNGDGLVTVEGEGEVIVKFPSGQTVKLKVDSFYESVHVENVEG